MDLDLKITTALLVWLVRTLSVTASIYSASAYADSPIATSQVSHARAHYFYCFCAQSSSERTSV